MSSLVGRVLTVVWAAILAVLIAMIGQGVWTTLIVTNLRTSPAIPWAVVVMAPLIWLMWQYLSGKWWPRNTSEARRRHLRANMVSGPVFAWALVAGGFSMGALAGCWIVMTQLVRMPANVLPDMSMYPWLTTALMVLMGSLLGPLLEQAGFWGYCQSILERKFPGPVAIVISSALFALLPHPPPDAVLWPKLVFYGLTGVTFGVTAYLTNSILPGITIHIAGDLTFFTLVWPYDTTRPLVGEDGADAWFWIHAAQAIVLTALAIVAFCRLARTAKRGRAVGSQRLLPDSAGEPAK